MCCSPCFDRLLCCREQFHASRFPNFSTRRKQPTCFLQSGACNVESVCEELLTEVATRDPQLQAFAWLEPEHIVSKLSDWMVVRSGPVGPATGCHWPSRTSLHRGFPLRAESMDWVGFRLVRQPLKHGWQRVVYFCDGHHRAGFHVTWPNHQSTWCRPTPGGSSAGSAAAATGWSRTLAAKLAVP